MESLLIRLFVQFRRHTSKRLIDTNRPDVDSKIFFRKLLTFLYFFSIIYLQKRKEKEMYNKEKLLNALNYIQSVCHKYDDCANCPMGDKDGDCLLRK